MDWLLTTLGLKQKSTREKVKDHFAESLHTVADALDQAMAESRQRAPELAEQAQASLGEAAQRAETIAGQVAEQATEAAESLRERTADPRARAAEATGHAADEANAKMAATLAALGGLTANWDQLLAQLSEELDQRRAQEPRPAPKEAEPGYPGFWLWLLRLGVGFWFIGRLRGRDLSAYIDHEAGDQMRRYAEGHPVSWYQGLLQEGLLPNASLVGLATIVGEAMVALALITGLNRRLGETVGVLLTGHELLLDYEDPARRGEHLALLLAQLLLLRTGG